MILLRPSLLLALALAGAVWGQGRGAGPAGGELQSALPVRAPEGRALLLRGPESRFGIPFFSPNAIPALAGEYLVGESLIGIWYTGTTLVYAGAWKESPTWSAGSPARAFVLEREGSTVVAWRFPSYSLLLEFPAAGPPMRRFALALLSRFGFFLANAPSEGDISFPAAVDF